MQFSCRIHFVPTGSVSLAMSQDPFGPHDDVGGVLFSFLPDLSNYFFSIQDGFGPFSDPSGGAVTNDTFFFSQLILLLG